MARLLDTHTFVWYIAGSHRLTSRARQAVENYGEQRLLSVASIWEMGIAVSLGRITLDRPFGEVVRAGIVENQLHVLELEIAHVTQLLELPFHHRDPFDRMLAAQCIEAGHEIISADEVFDRYNVARIW